MAPKLRRGGGLMTNAAKAVAEALSPGLATPGTCAPADEPFSVTTSPPGDTSVTVAPAGSATRVPATSAVPLAIAASVDRTTI